MICRPGCAARSIAPSIGSPTPAMPAAKPARGRCAQLDDALRCRIFGRPDRPAVCGQLQPSPEMCGTQPDGSQHAMLYLARLESLTAPQ